ncbi:MAG: glycoside hydrolase family 3 C-terminal domain-containing protein [Phaeodactylibacter sp.]|uniref:glycoside hydrolase family 3 C-terminal domain-containing protein n=1 Tax=Phaeodactylibacter sp. TaxID=1940289 RepID=UPI0032EB2709
MTRKIHLLLFALLLCHIQGSAQSLPVYQDTAYTYAERADDLVQRMTLEEKIAQLQNQMHLAKPGDLGVGAFGFMSKDADIEASTEAYNTYQRAQIEHTRLGIPATRSGEGLFAYMGNGSTSFPSPLGIAASFNPDLSARVAAVLSKELKSRGISRVLAPVVNLTRDPRWGRTNETYGEDPYLSGIMGAAYVREMEKAGLSTMVKHFAANMGLDGQFTGPVHFTERHLREYYFPAFKTCIEAGASSVMMAYNNIDGIPCATNPWLIQGILKDEWGLEGFVSTDGNSSTLIFEEAGIYKTPKELAAALMNAGCDKSSPSSFFDEPLREAIKEGLVPVARLNDAVRRILLQKLETGIFEQPYADPAAAIRLNNHPDHRAVAREAAQQALVLLKNDNQCLPFSKSVQKVAVVGPLADWLMVGHYGGFGREEVTVLDGIRQLLPAAEVTYTKGVEMQYFGYPPIDERHLNGPVQAAYFDNENLEGQPKIVRSENRIEHDWKNARPKGIPASNFSVRWSGSFNSPVSGPVRFGVTMDDGARLYLDGQLIIDEWKGGGRRMKEAVVELEQGKTYPFTLEYFDGGFSSYVQLGWDINEAINIPKAVEAAMDADAVVVVAGMYENENWDRTSLDLSVPQEELIRTLAALGKPMAVVLQSGTVLTMYKWIDDVDAVMMAWYPGCEGGHAIASALFGNYNPGGKLPITFPKVTGQVPLNYNRHPNGKGKIKFIGDFNEPLFPFGHGLSYSQFEYDGLELSASMIRPGDTVTVRFRVTNTSDRAGEEVAQLYLHDNYASVTQPIKKLVGFKRFALEPGETQRVTLKILPEQLKIWDINMNHVIEPGTFELMVGTSSEDLRLSTSLTVEE